MSSLPFLLLSKKNLTALSTLSDVDCQFYWNNWGACDKETGEQSRTITITQEKMHGGAACPDPEVRDCDVDCEYNWQAWVPAVCIGGQHTTQTRSITITTPCALRGNCDSGSMHQGTPCPADETTPCDDKPCEYTWTDWTDCILDAPVGNQSRTATVSEDPVGNGTKCPDPEHQTCPVDCVYSWTRWSDCDEN